jgi:uncharacterized protein (UPF0332 family)
LAILNPEHLLQQAERLIASGGPGQPRQIDLRRAISAAYYAVFHAALTGAADQFIGVTRRTTSQYGLVYRSIDHRALRDLCIEAAKEKVASRYAFHVPGGGFGTALRDFAETVIELQQKRNSADYDPLIRVKSSDAQLAINIARNALDRLHGAGGAAREAFFSLLLFDPRG